MYHSKCLAHNKNQGYVIYNQKSKPSIEIDPEMIHMLKLVYKDFKTAIKICLKI